MKRDFIRFLIAAILSFLIFYQGENAWFIIRLLGGFCFWIALYYGGKLVMRPLGVI
ncbi:hypothetical protein [Bacteroides oleiciplenus]|uniref:Uncharacterized protein n=1 Tax=Bacteroides oleiciplenus YIT 12058 TaxID=742727 RepID=K9EMB5_9BACE|nr:hypothetical protein [Bacteroides oleiciplenus]EKU90280.1 hypothetical protein HMPREF9447_01698 [Bacteroides oleiciplenus YIT 12058]